MTTFGLVHGGGHGAWCWQRVIASLQHLGSEAIAMDLPVDSEQAGAREYADVILNALADVRGPVVLVAHSLGGAALPLVAEKRETKRMIFLSATLPVPGKSLDQQRAEEPDMLFPYVGENGGLNKDRFYNRCTPEDADWACRQMRYQARKVFAEITPLQEWPPVPISCIVCSEDHAVNPEWGRRAAHRRFGVEAVVLVGSDHSPMISRPDELARLFVRLGEG